MTLFLDVNVWLPLLWEGHSAHRAATTWAGQSSGELVLCRVTELALLRHFTNPAILGSEVLANSEAADLVDSLRRQERIQFATEPEGLEDRYLELGGAPYPSRNRWTDSYLAAFAICGGHRLISFDRGFAQYESAGLEWELLIS